MKTRIEQLLKKPEGKQLEFKRDLSSVKNIMKTLISFANSSGGTSIIGVENPLDEEERLCSLISDYSKNFNLLSGTYGSNQGISFIIMTIEDMKQGISKIRNLVIARVFRELDLIEQWGSGVRR